MMVEKTVKKAIGGVIRRTRNYIRYLEEESNGRATEQGPRKHSTGEDEFAHIWLNSVFKKLVAEPDCSVRPYYTWGVLQGARLGKAIGIDRISVIEFGVAGGVGLVALDRIAERVEQNLGIGIDVYGFD